MPVFHLNDLPKNKRIQLIGEFYDVINSLENRDEVRSFFKSLLTPDEFATLMRRVEIAVLLTAKYKYCEISEILGVGNDKISNVQRALQQDDNGYKIIVKRLIENRKNRLRKNRKVAKEAAKMSPLAGVKKRYKAHFVLDNLIDAAIEKIEEDDKALEKEAILYTPSSKSLRK